MKQTVKKYWWVITLVITFDQLTKLLCRGLDGKIVVFPAFPELLNIFPVENTGISFGMMSGSSRIMGIVSLAVIIILLALLWKNSFSGLVSVGIALIIGGGISNVIDRIVTSSVLDMIATWVFPWAVFNIADVAVVAGCIMAGIGIIIKGVKSGGEGSNG